MGPTLQYSDGSLKKDVRLIHAGLAFVIPGLIKLVWVQREMNLTDNEASSAQRPGDIVSLAKVALTYNLSDDGVVMALCRAPQTYVKTVRVRFESIVNAVLRDLPDDTDLSDVEVAVLNACRQSDELKECGVVPITVSIPELNDTPATQYIRAIRAALAAYGGVSSLMPFVLSPPASSNGSNGHSNGAGKVPRTT